MLHKPTYSNSIVSAAVTLKFLGWQIFFINLQKIVTTVPGLPYSHMCKTQLAVKSTIIPPSFTATVTMDPIFPEAEAPIKKKNERDLLLTLLINLLSVSWTRPLTVQSIK